MQIKDFLSGNDVLIDLAAPDKFRLLRDLSERAAASLSLRADAIMAAIQKREALGSTGTGGGVAIPHARLTELTSPFGILARLKNPIDFDSVDGRPVDLVLMLLLPESRGADQLPALACAARILRDTVTVRRLRSLPDQSDVYQAMLERAD
jgi:PTS system nitrogen regulatory IIA component